MAQQEMIQNILAREYTKAKSKNPSFSQRAFAKRLGLSSGAMSSLMNGKRNISDKLAERILDRLAISPDEKQQVLKPTKIKTINRTRKETKLSIDVFEALSNPLHFNLLSLIEINDYQSDPTKMAKKLGVTKKEITTAIDRLKRLRLIEEQDQNLIATEEELASPDEVISPSIKNHHLESMEEAKESLYRDDINMRDFTSQTLAINLEKLPAVKNLIRTFGDQLAELVTDGEKEEVYKLNVQFFPVTRIES